MLHSSCDCAFPHDGISLASLDVPALAFSFHSYLLISDFHSDFSRGIFLLNLSHASKGPVLLSRTYPLIYRIEANISAWLESFYIEKNRKAQGQSKVLFPGFIVSAQGIASDLQKGNSGNPETSLIRLSNTFSLLN